MNELQRLRSIVNWVIFSGYAKNDADLAIKMGYSKSSFSQIMNGKVPLSDRFIHSLCSFDKNINFVWIRNGSGEMLSRSSGVVANYEKKGVPFYDVDFIGGFDLVLNDQSLAPAYYIDFPMYNDSDFWINVRGNSMHPLISSGDMVAIKLLNDWRTYILYGEIYGIITDSYRTIKRVRRSQKGDDYILLVPINHEYDEQDIPCSIVRFMYSVLGSAKKII